MYYISQNQGAKPLSIKTLAVGSPLISEGLSDPALRGCLTPSKLIGAPSATSKLYM